MNAAVWSRIYELASPEGNSKIPHLNDSYPHLRQIPPDLPRNLLACTMASSPRGAGGVRANQWVQWVYSSEVNKSTSSWPNLCHMNSTPACEGVFSWQHTPTVGPKVRNWGLFQTWRVLQHVTFYNPGQVIVEVILPESESNGLMCRRSNGMLAAAAAMRPNNRGVGLVWCHSQQQELDPHE